MTSVVILAGGSSPIWTEFANVPYKALVTIGGDTMVSRTVQAFRDTGLNDIIVLGEWASDEENEYRLVRSGPSFVANLVKGLELAVGDFVVVSTADMPCINEVSIARFITSCELEKCAVGYPIVRLEECRKAFPEMKRTAVKFQEGIFTGGNLVWVEKDRFLEHISIIEKLYDARKHPFQLASLIGFDFACKMLVGQCVTQLAMSISEAEKVASRWLDMSVKAIPSTYELGVDIDTTEHLRSFLRTTILSP